MGPLRWERGALTTGPPRQFLTASFFFKPSRLLSTQKALTVGAIKIQDSKPEIETDADMSVDRDSFKAEFHNCFDILSQITIVGRVMLCVCRMFSSVPDLLPARCQ